MLSASALSRGAIDAVVRGRHASFAWLRRGGEGARPVVADVIFATAGRRGHRPGLRRPGRWREILSTDAAQCGGSGRGSAGTFVAEEGSGNRYRWLAVLALPPLAAIWLTPDDD